MIISLSLITLCWLIYIQLFSRDPGYIDSWDTDENFHPTLLQYRMNKKQSPINLLDFTKILDSLKPAPKVRKINFDVSGFKSGSNFDSFAKKYTEQSSLAANTDFDFGKLFLLSCLFSCLRCRTKEVRSCFRAYFILT